MVKKLPLNFLVIEYGLTTETGQTLKFVCGIGTLFTLNHIMTNFHYIYTLVTVLHTPAYILVRSFNYSKKLNVEGSHQIRNDYTQKTK